MPGLGLFLPSETAYKDPNRFRDVLEAEATKEAKYLSDMDQFYAQLGESIREFDKTSEMKDRQFEESLAFDKDKLEWQSEENSLERSLKRWQTSEQIGLGYEEVGAKREATAMEADYRFGTLELEKKKFAQDQSESGFLRDLYTSAEGRKKETHETAKTFLGGMKGTAQVGGIKDYGVIQEGKNVFGDLSQDDETASWSNTTW